MMLESSAAVKNRSVKEASFKLLSALVHKYQQLDVVSGAMIDLMNKHEHLSTTLAELAEFASQHHNDPRLVSPLEGPQWTCTSAPYTPQSPRKVACGPAQVTYECVYVCVVCVCVMQPSMCICVHGGIALARPEGGCI